MIVSIPRLSLAGLRDLRRSTHAEYVKLLSAPDGDFRRAGLLLRRQELARIDALIDQGPQGFSSDESGGALCPA